jgi:hypothetical protein
MNTSRMDDPDEQLIFGFKRFFVDFELKKPFQVGLEDTPG